MPATQWFGLCLCAPTLAIRSSWPDSFDFGRGNVICVCPLIVLGGQNFESIRLWQNIDVALYLHNMHTRYRQILYARARRIHSDVATLGIEA